MSKKETIHILTHKGCMDGATCAALLKAVFDDKFKVEIFQNSPNDIKLDKSLEYLKTGKCKFLFVTDLNLTNIDKDILNEFTQYSNKHDNCFAIDHHEGITPSKNILINPDKRSASNMVYEIIESIKFGKESLLNLSSELTEMILNMNTEKLSEFKNLVDVIDRIDTIDEKGLDDQAKQLVWLFKKQGVNKYIKSTSQSPKYRLDGQEIEQYNADEAEKKTTLENFFMDVFDKNKKITGIYRYKEDSNWIKKRFIRVLFNSNTKLISVPDLVEQLKNNPLPYDIIEIIKLNDKGEPSVSVISLNDTDVSTIADLRGGGGHKFASGYKLSNKKFSRMVSVNTDGDGTKNYQINPNKYIETKDCTIVKNSGYGTLRKKLINKSLVPFNTCDNQLNIKTEPDDKTNNRVDNITFDFI